MIYFKSRKEVREFAKITGRKAVDLGKDADKRWAVSIF